MAVCILRDVLLALPAKIDIARVMESLRILAAAEGSPAAEKRIDLFHRTFLNTIRQYGRAMNSAWLSHTL